MNADLIKDNFGYWNYEAGRTRPDKVAMIDLSNDRERRVTYATLEERLNRFASLTRALGLNPGDRMAMVIGNRYEFVEIMYGAMRAGVVPVPLNTKLGPDTLEYILADAGCRAAAVDPACNRVIVDVVNGSSIEHRIALDQVPDGWADYEAALAAASPDFTPPAIGPDHPSFQPYTSGSTGRPKGVVLTHGGQYWWTRAVQHYWPGSPDQRALAAVPLYHKNAMAGAIKPMLHIGGSVVILPDFEPRRFLTVLSEYRCTYAGAVPAVFTLLLQQRDLIESLDFSALESLKLGSAPVQEELMVAVKQAFGCGISESYGLTEGGPVMIGPPTDGRAVPFGSCGVAWPEGEVKLVDANGNEHPSDGELWVRNPGVTPGYHNLPEVNAKRLKDGWLATGDLFHLDEDGFFYFRGRTDDMFNSGGENIYPKEVENLLISHASVFDASVVPVVHPVKGHVPVAMVMLEKDGNADERALKTYCLDNGPAYAHPRRVRIVPQMPLNGAGKVDRTIVQQQLADAFEADIARSARER
ncbi:MAG: class I adenylate-forming enzyme family protein [Pseudomonadota bacterium]